MRQGRSITPQSPQTNPTTVFFRACTRNSNIRSESPYNHNLLRPQFHLKACNHTLPTLHKTLEAIDTILNFKPEALNPNLNPMSLWAFPPHEDVRSYDPPLVIHTKPSRLKLKSWK